MSPDDENEYGFDRTGRAKYYRDEDGQLVPVKATGLATFAAFIMLSVLGVVVAATQANGNWWLQIGAVFVTLVGLVGSSRYKWHIVYWDLFALGVCLFSVYAHLKHGSSS